MKASQIRALANIADKPGASVSAQLIATAVPVAFFVMAARQGGRDWGEVTPRSPQG